MVLEYKGTIEGSKTFLRRYHIESDMTLYDLHIFLQHDMGFAPDQMVMFKGINDKGRVRSQYCLFDLGDGAMDAVTLEQTLKKGEVALVWVYNIKNNCGITLTFEQETQERPRCNYPLLVEEKGQNPQQFAKKYSEEIDQFLEEMSSSGSNEEYDDDELPEGIEEEN